MRDVLCPACGFQLRFNDPIPPGGPMGICNSCFEVIALTGPIWATRVTAVSVPLHALRAFQQLEQQSKAMHRARHGQRILS